MYVEVIINSPTRVLDRTYTYGDGGFDISIGDMVRVSFGKGRDNELAFVMNVLETLPQDLEGVKLKAVKAVVTPGVFTAHAVPVIEFLRKRYLSTYLEAIRLFLPKGDLERLRHKKRKVLIPRTPPERESWRPVYEFIERMRATGGVIRAEAVKAGYSQSSIDTMVKRGHLEIVEENDLRIDEREFETYEERNLTEEQESVLERIVEGPQGVYLLHGVTGSGKTEVFLRLVAQTLKGEGDNVILVPEIALTPQLVERVKGRFGNGISIFHSRLSDGERFDEWMRVKEGKVRIAIGARSALFLPFKDLKTIVIDEEHESSYKSDISPRYITSEVAEFMVGQNGGKVLLCSATPSLESFRKAEKGEYTLLTMTERPGGGRMPDVTIVDLRQELRNGNRSVISVRLKEAMDEALFKKEQIILFLNRRGHSGFVSCRSCGFVYRCRNCSVSLTKHRGGRLICHHCGHMEFQGASCPNCGSGYVKEFGLGTEKVEEEVRKLYPRARIIRMDRDTTGKKEDYENIYRTFKNGEADILIGTQMVAKGLDFDNVSLVGIISADLTMNMPDFRAYEKTYQLLTQVSGRAGRKKAGGRVIIQTYEPMSYPVQTSARGDYRGFYTREIENRKMGSYPPEGDLFTIVVSGKDEGRLERKMKFLKEGILKIIEESSESLTLLGPTQCLISRLREYYRHQMIIKGRISEATGRRIKDYIVENLTDGDYRLVLDLNPTVIV